MKVIVFHFILWDPNTLSQNPLFRGFMRYRPSIMPLMQTEIVESYSRNSLVVNEGHETYSLFCLSFAPTFSFPPDFRYKRRKNASQN